MLELERNHSRRANTCALILIISVGLAAILAPPADAHQGHNHAPWRACESSQLGEACQWTSHQLLYRGTCRGVQSRLVCVRNKPIVATEEDLSARLAQTGSQLATLTATTLSSAWELLFAPPRA